jgi:hypothetical protein
MPYITKSEKYFNDLDFKINLIQVVSEGRGQWLRLALSKGPNWVGVFFPPFFTWGRKQIQFPKRRVSSNTGRWIKSRNPEIPNLIQFYKKSFANDIYATQFNRLLEKLIHNLRYFIPPLRIFNN